MRQNGRLKPTQGLRISAALLYSFALVLTAGAVFAGVWLILRKHPICSPSGNGIQVCDDSTRDFRNIGIGVIAVGVVMGLLLVAIGRLCEIVSNLRDRQVIRDRAAAPPAPPAPAVAGAPAVAAAPAAPPRHPAAGPPVPWSRG
jgi:hypothetical protein